MPQLTKRTELRLFALAVMLFVPVYGEVLLYFGWTKLSGAVTLVVFAALFWSIGSAFRRQSKDTTNGTR
jgi:hypothetical protein